MTTYVAALYSIILPKGRLVMKDLIAVAESLGLDDPRTFLATGNLMFESRRRDAAALERDLEAAFADRFGKHIDFLIRTAEQWHALTVGNPFPTESEANGSQVGVRIQRKELTTAVFAELKSFQADDEKLALVDGDLWFAFPQQMSQSRLLAAMTVKRLGIGTNRSWNTVRRVDELLRKE